MNDSEIKTGNTSNWGFRLGGVLVVLMALWLYTLATTPTLLPVGAPAPGFNLHMAGRGGETLSLAQLKGKVVVLDFWSWGCAPCIEEAKELEFTHRNLKSRGVAVVGVSAWGESDEEVLAFKEKKRLSYPLLTGTEKMVEAYKARSLPTLYIIDRSGRIALSHVGFMSRDQIEKAASLVLEEGE